ncbi:MAG: hypothetical protein J5739_04975 [Lachnospiraceae bacterium]|nr:hypothetical protein [Lachnospiraceae bacterium]
MCYINDEWIKNRTGMFMDDFMKLVIRVLSYTKIRIQGNMLESYDLMNRFLIERILA